MRYPPRRRFPLPQNRAARRRRRYNPSDSAAIDGSLSAINAETGYCDIVLYSNGFVKGGKSRDILKRYKAHRATAAALGISARGAFHTEPHEDYHANEKRLLSALGAVSESRVGEFFRGIDRESAIEILDSLGFGINAIGEPCGEWFMAFQDSFEELAKDRELWASRWPYCATYSASWILKTISRSSRRISPRH